MPSSFRLFQRLHLININKFTKVKIKIQIKKNLTFVFILFSKKNQSCKYL